MRNVPISNDEFVQHFQENQELIEESARMGKRLTVHHRGFTGQSFGLADSLFLNLDQDDRDFFWERLIDGAGLEVGNPIYALREFLIREDRAAATRPRVRVEVAVAMLIKAWNAYREGREVRLLAYKPGGAHPEAFPEPI